MCAVSVIIHFTIGVAPDDNDCLPNGRSLLCRVVRGCKIYFGFMYVAQGVLK